MTPTHHHGHRQPTPVATADDDQIGQAFLDQLRDQLDAAGNYGTASWRETRDAQMHRLSTLDWEPSIIAIHYRVTIGTVHNAIRRHQQRIDGNTHELNRGHWWVDVPGHDIRVRADEETARRLATLLTDHDITARLRAPRRARQQADR